MVNYQRKGGGGEEGATEREREGDRQRETHKEMTDGQKERQRVT